MENVDAVSKKDFWFQILKGVLFATSFSLVSILVFALIIVWIGVTDNFIVPVNQVIKVASIFIGVFFALKQSYSKGLVKGALIGFFYTLVAYIMFSALSSNFIFNVTLLNDIVFGTIIGAICGIIVVNLKK